MYFFRFADFKLQRKCSFAVMENFDPKFIASLLNEENTIKEVSLILQDMYTNKRALSIRYLKRYCAKHEISKRVLQNTLHNLVADTAQKMKFSIKDFFSKCDQIRSFLNGKLHFLCSERHSKRYVLEVGIIMCIRCNSSPHCNF